MICKAAMPNTYDICKYSIENLKNILSCSPDVDVSALESKLHIIYFEEYFSALCAKTIVIEEDYVDRDFIEDYAGYYVRCFKKYRRKCRRLHFFSSIFSKDEFKFLIQGKPSPINQEQLKKSYLGFIVAKPLPQTIIGRTCLKTYPDEGGRRHYSSTQSFGANLFGIQLVIQTLPFQEQDNVVAACATSALWSVFHGSGFIFQHPIPSPVEITRNATSMLPLETRSLPNRGLTGGQMAYAIRSVGLEPFLVDATNLTTLRGTAYAYLRGGLPLLLGLQLIDTSYSTGASLQGNLLGRHAVALTGFSLGGQKSDTYLCSVAPAGFYLRRQK